jgi:hypothetical protein
MSRIGLPTPAPAAAGQPAWRRVLWIGALGIAAGTLLLGLQFARLGPDLTAPFFVGSSWGLDDGLAARGIDVDVVEGTGYDGQWFLGLAYDPLLLDDLSRGFDMPRYRAGRPLMAVAGWLLAAGGLLPIPLGLLLVGPLACGLGAAATARVLASAGWPPWLGLLFCAVPGVGVGVMFVTAEPLALACALVGVSLAIDRRPLAAGIAFAAGGLAKENYLVFAAVAAVAFVAEHGRPWAARVRGAVATVGPGVLALAAWWGWVALMVPPRSVDARAARAVAPPLVGWADTLGRIADGRWVADAPVGPLGVVLMVGSLAVLVAGIAAGLRRPGLLGWTGLVLGGFGLCLSPELLGHFLSAMRALAPCVLGAALAVAVALRPVPAARVSTGGGSGQEIVSG